MEETQPGREWSSVFRIPTTNKKSVNFELYPENVCQRGRQNKTFSEIRKLTELITIRTSVQEGTKETPRSVRRKMNEIETGTHTKKRNASDMATVWINIESFQCIKFYKISHCLTQKQITIYAVVYNVS